jgi:hypothetical protein
MIVLNPPRPLAALPEAQQVSFVSILNRKPKYTFKEIV